MAESTSSNSSFVNDGTANKTVLITHRGSVVEQYNNVSASQLCDLVRNSQLFQQAWNSGNEGASEQPLWGSALERQAETLVRSLTVVSTNRQVLGVAGDHKGVFKLSFHKAFDLEDPTCNGNLSFLKNNSVGFHGFLNAFDPRTQGQIRAWVDGYNPDTEIVILATVAMKGKLLMTMQTRPKPSSGDLVQECRGAVDFKCSDESSIPLPTNGAERRLCQQCGGLSRWQCSACKAHYCCKECQKSHWTSHRVICGRVQNILESFE